MYAVAFGNGHGATVTSKGEILTVTSAKARRLVAAVLADSALVPVKAEADPNEPDEDGTLPVIEENWRRVETNERAHTYAALMTLEWATVSFEDSDEETVKGSGILEI